MDPSSFFGIQMSNKNWIVMAIVRICWEHLHTKKTADLLCSMSNRHRTLLWPKCAFRNSTISDTNEICRIQATLNKWVWVFEAFNKFMDLNMDLNNQATAFCQFWPFLIQCILSFRSFVWIWLLGSILWSKLKQITSVHVAWHERRPSFNSDARLFGGTLNCFVFSLVLFRLERPQYCEHWW